MKDDEDEDGAPTDGSLTKANRDWITALMTALLQIIETLGEPIDTKVLAMLEMTYDMLEQQLAFDIYYEWEQKDSEDDANKIGPNKPDNPDDTPSLEDLNGWFKI